MTTQSAPFYAFLAVVMLALVMSLVGVIIVRRQKQKRPDVGKAKDEWK